LMIRFKSACNATMPNANILEEWFENELPDSGIHISQTNIYAVKVWLKWMPWQLLRFNNYGKRWKENCEMYSRDISRPNSCAHTSNHYCMEIYSNKRDLSESVTYPWTPPLINGDIYLFKRTSHISKSLWFINYP
jgi:hypothetical protein